MTDADDTIPPDAATAPTDPAPAGFVQDHLLDEQILRNRIADDASAAVGTGSTGPAARQDAYALRLFPEHEDARTRAQMADAMYSCGLSALAALRASLVDAPELHEPYSTHIGAALAWLASIAQRMNAYVPLHTRAQCADFALDRGDLLVVDGPVHVIVVTDKLDNGDVITSEGGMPEVSSTGERGMCIHSRTMRTRRTIDGRIQTGTVDAKGLLTWGRIANYKIDPAFLRRSDEQ